jgi:hypothetical protein
MSYQGVETRRFARQYKKLHDNVAADVDAAVSAVETSPKIGDQKKGDLAAYMFINFEFRDSFTCWATRSARSLNWYTSRQLEHTETFIEI